MSINISKFDTEIPEASIVKLKAYKIGEDVEFHLFYKCESIKYYDMFNPPDGNIFMLMKEVSNEDKEKGFLTFRVPFDTLKKCEEITFFLSIDEKYSKRNGCYFKNNIDYSAMPCLVEFPDKNFAQEIYSQINKTGQILDSDLQEIELLDLSNCGITDINGIQYISNLKILDITNNNITDISYLNNLNNLERLYLKGNPIKDYALDEELLSKLIIYDCQREFERELYANRLKEMGIFRGTGEGFELYREPNRIESLIILIRLLGNESDAIQSDTSTSKFSDVSTWAVGYTNYAFNNGLTNGIGNGKFETTELINAKSYITFVLRALGYSDKNGDFAWKKSISFAHSIGLIDDTLQDELNNTKFTRGYVSEVTYKALSLNLKNSNITLAQKLVDSGSIDQNIAKKYELY